MQRSPCSANSCRAVSMPSRSPARRMSITTRRGRSLMASSIASSPEAATPTTSNPASMSADSTCMATRKSSSTTRMRSDASGRLSDPAASSRANASRGRPDGGGGGLGLVGPLHGGQVSGSRVPPLKTQAAPAGRRAGDVELSADLPGEPFDQPQAGRAAAHRLQIEARTVVLDVEENSSVSRVSPTRMVPWRGRRARACPHW